MRLLLDTNIVLDVLLKRRPFDEAAVKIFALAERKWFEGFLGATTVTTVYYLARKHTGELDARRRLRSLLAIFDLAKVDRAVVDRAIDGGFRDFEDAVLHEAGVGIGADGIITRNVTDFEGVAKMPVYSPDDFLSMVRSLQVSAR